MLSRTRLLLPLVVLAAAVPAAPASAATARFTATFEAEKTVAWDQPRGVSQVSCRGEHYSIASGDETWRVNINKPFKVVVSSGFRGLTTWQFDSWSPMRVDLDGVEGTGYVQRALRTESGTTGGWCNPGGSKDPQPENDCGTQLPRYQVRFSAHRGQVDWSMTPVEWMANERLGFYQCHLFAPEGVPVGSFPRLTGTFRTKDLFNRRKRTIVVGNRKSYGPESYPVVNLGVEQTTSAKVAWKLTLRRK